MKYISKQQSYYQALPIIFKNKKPHVGAWGQYKLTMNEKQSAFPAQGAGDARLCYDKDIDLERFSELWSKLSLKIQQNPTTHVAFKYTNLAVNIGIVTGILARILRTSKQ